MKMNNLNGKLHALATQIDELKAFIMEQLFEIKSSLQGAEQLGNNNDYHDNDNYVKFLQD